MQVWCGQYSVRGAYHPNEDRVSCWPSILPEAPPAPGAAPTSSLIVLCDGHDGHACAEFVQARFAGAFKAKLLELAPDAADLPADFIARADATPLGPADEQGRPLNPVGRALQAAFTAVENEWLAAMEAAAADAPGAVSRLVRTLSGRSLNEPANRGKGSSHSGNKAMPALSRVKGGTSGACATAIAIIGSKVYVAGVGDCRALLRRADGGVFVLTTDHRCSNPRERERILGLGGYIRNERVDGVLEPSRTLGDLQEKFGCPHGVLTHEPDMFCASLSDPSRPVEGVLGGPLFWMELKAKEDDMHLARALAAIRVEPAEGSVPATSAIKNYPAVVPRAREVGVCISELNEELLALAKTRGLPGPLRLQPPSRPSSPGGGGGAAPVAGRSASRGRLGPGGGVSAAAGGAAGLQAHKPAAPAGLPQLLTFTKTRALAWAPNVAPPPGPSHGLPPPAHPLLRPITVPEARASASYLPIAFVLVASDGVWDVISSDEAAAIVTHALAVYGDATAAAAELVRHACDRGSADDVTAAVAWLHRAEPGSSEGGSESSAAGGAGSSSVVSLLRPSEPASASPAVSAPSSASSSRSASLASTATSRISSAGSAKSGSGGGSAASRPAVKPAPTGVGGSRRPV